MKKAPTYKELKQENAILRERIAYLERMLFGAKSDKIAMPPSDDSSGLFDDWFKDAMDEKAEKIRKTKRLSRERHKNIVLSPIKRPIVLPNTNIMVWKNVSRLSCQKVWMLRNAIL